MVATQETKKDIYCTKSGAMSDSTENKNRYVCRLNQANFFLCHRFFVVGIFILVTLPILTRCPNISIVNF